MFCEEHKNQFLDWTPRWVKAVFGFLAGTASILGFALYFRPQAPNSNQPSTNAPVRLEQEASNAGRTVLKSLNEFPVEGNYTPSGKIGDTSDVTINELRDGARRFTYITEGKGPHQWEYRFERDEPAQFAGVMYLSPPNIWGTLPDSGYDLRGFRSVAGEARSLGGPVNVNLIVGGITWFWDEQKKEKVKSVYGDSMRKSEAQNLTEEWKPFHIVLNDSEGLKRLVGGFGWIISWGENQIQLNRDRTSAENPKTFIIELRNVRFMKGSISEK